MWRRNSRTTVKHGIYQLIQFAQKYNVCQTMFCFCHSTELIAGNIHMPGRFVRHSLCTFCLFFPLLLCSTYFNDFFFKNKIYSCFAISLSFNAERRNGGLVACFIQQNGLDSCYFFISCMFLSVFRVCSVLSGIQLMVRKVLLKTMKCFQFFFSLLIVLNFE